MSHRHKVLGVTLGFLCIDPLTPALAQSFPNMHSAAGRPIGASSWGSQATASNFARAAAAPYGQQQLLPFGALHSAAINQAPAGSQNINLDLTSAIRNIIVGANVFGGAPSVTIDLGGSSQSFKAGSTVTAAEYVAIQQTLGGSQSIALSPVGTATGGSFSLNSVAKRNVLDVVIPAGVTALDYTSRAAIRIRGDLTNYGSIETIAGGANHQSITILASDFTNAAGGIISSLNTPVDLTLRSTNDFVNAGQIFGSGNINLNAGSGVFSNTGLISTNTGNINFSTPSAGTDISINARGGTFNAPAGNINVRTEAYNGSANINLTGGNYLSQNLNLYSGNGAITGNVGQVTSQLNSAAAVAHFSADTANLILGCNTINGDPVISNTGNITISGVNTFSEDVAFLAQGDIVAGNSSAAIIAKGHNVTLVAGAKLDIQTDVTVDFSTPLGGSIDLSASGTSTIIDTSSGSGKGGNVTLVALAAGTKGGTIALPSTGKITTSSAAAEAGNVLIMASAAPATTTATINIGSVEAAGSGTGGNAGQVQILTAAPAAGQVVFQPDGSSKGTITSSGVVSKNAGVNVNSIITVGYSGVGGSGPTNGGNGGDGGNISIVAGGNIVTAGDLLAFGGGGGGGGGWGYAGSNGGAGGRGGNINLNSTGGSIYVSSDINTSGGGGGGGGGAGGLKLVPGIGGVGGSAGSIKVTTYSGDATFNGLVFASSGGNGGDGNASGGNAGGGGGSYGAGGGGGAGGYGYGAGGGGGYVSVNLNQSAAGGGGATQDSFVTGASSGGGGGGFNGTTIGPGLGGTGQAGYGTDGNLTSGGSAYPLGLNGQPSGVGGLNVNGAGGTGGTAMGQNAAPGGSQGSSPTAIDGNISLTARAINLQSTAAPVTVYGKNIQINTAVGNVVSKTYLADANYGSAVNTYDPSLKVGPVNLSGNIQTSGPINSLVINGAVQTPTLGPGTYTPGGITISRDLNVGYVILPGMKVTPAEYVAITQVQKDGVQSIGLTGSGPGTGVAWAGVINFDTENLPAGGFTNFYLPGTTNGVVSAPTLTVNGTFYSSGSFFMNAPVSTLNVGSTTYFGSSAIFNGNTTNVISGGAVTAGGNVTAPNGALNITATTGDVTVYNLLSARSISVTALAADGNVIATTGGNIVTSLVASPGESKIVLTAGSNGTIFTALSGVIKGAAVELNAALIDNNGRIETGTGPSIGDYYLRVSNPSGPLSLTGAGKWISPTATAFFSKGDLDLGNLTTSALPLLTSNLTLSAVGGNIHLVPNEISVMPTSNGNGGQLNITANSIIAFVGFSPITLKADGDTTGDGGSIYLNITGSSPLVLGSSPYNYLLYARGGATSGNGGQVFIQTQNDLIADFSTIKIAPQSTTGSGGTIFLYSYKSINLTGGNTLAVNGVGNGDGGFVHLDAAAINYPSTGGAFNITANGSGYGKGGRIEIDSDVTTPMFIGSGLNNLNFSAQGGPGGTALNPADGGAISFITGGALTVNAANINVSAGGTDGSGGSIYLKAGTGTLGGNLLVNGNLSANGIGDGDGGTISLMAKGKTLFTVSTARTTNGVAGLLSVNGSGTGKDGSISIGMSGDGGVKIAQPLSEISSLTVTAGKGGVVVASSVGNADASIYLAASGAGKISQSARTLITAKQLNTLSGSGSITLSNLDVRDISANTGTKANVVITNTGSTFGATYVNGVRGANVTIKAVDFLIAGNITGNTIALSTTSKTYGAMQIGPITATNTITATTNDTLEITPGSILTTPKNITLSVTGVNGQLVMQTGSKISTGAALAMTMAKSTHYQGLNIKTGAQIEAATATMTATKGQIVANGSIQTTGAIKITAADQIIAHGSLRGNTGVSLTTTSYTGPQGGGIEIKDISTGWLGSTGGAIKVIAAGGQLVVDPSAQILASSTKGTKASILLQNKRAFSGAPTIDILSSANIITSGAAGGSVNIAVGTATTTTKGNLLPTISGVTFNPGNPQKLIFLGEKSVTFTSGITQVNVIGKGVAVTFNTGKLDPTNITIHGGTAGSPTVITADPPVAVADIAVPKITSTNSLPMLTISPNRTQKAAETNVTPTAARSDQIEITANLQISTRSGVYGLPQLAQPIAISSDGRNITLSRGYRLVASGKHSTSVKTNFGTVDIAPEAIVLIVAVPNGTSIYNLHDNRDGAVRVSCGAQKIKVVPGGHVTLTSANVESYEHVNPAEFIGHRNMQSRALDEGLRLFTSEFSILHAIGSVVELRQMFASTDSESQKMANSLLKTSAIVFHLVSSKAPFKCYRPASKMLTASARASYSLNQTGPRADY